MPRRMPGYARRGKYLATILDEGLLLLMNDGSALDDNWTTRKHRAAARKKRAGGRRPLHVATTFDERLLLLDFGEQLNESFLALCLILSCVAFRYLRDIHRAEFRAAHGAKLGVLVKIVGQSFVVHAARGIGIERKLKLFVPVE